MNTLFLGIVIFLIVLAVFDLVVGVSNDAVNFLNSAIGAKVARYRTVVTVAAIGVFAGAALSNGMMDVARHGIMTPAYFSFYDVMCVFLAVMVTDVVLLDVFNTLGMPTSTTVSLVFELLGGAFAIALIQISGGATTESGALLTLGDLLNTEKAISVILGIFLSVALSVCSHRIRTRHYRAMDSTRCFHIYISCKRTDNRPVGQDGRQALLVAENWNLWRTVGDRHRLVFAYQRIEGQHADDSRCERDD